MQDLNIPDLSTPVAVATNDISGIVALFEAPCEDPCTHVPEEPVDKGSASHRQFIAERFDVDGTLLPTTSGTGAVVGTGGADSHVGVALHEDGRVATALPSRILALGVPDAFGRLGSILDPTGSLTTFGGEGPLSCCSTILAFGWGGLVDLSYVDHVARLSRWAVDPFGTFMDDAGAFESYIEEIAAAEITLGCHESGLLYCPDDAVTRAQMASFLARWLGLALDAADRFADDEGSVHEAAIDAIARVGITAGCDATDSTRFCPDDPVSRAQMASFLARALGLALDAPDAFSDDDGLVHEAAIDAIALEEITVGCDPNVFCPLDPVERDELAAFLVRAGLDQSGS